MGYVATQSAVARLIRAAEQEAWLWVDDIFITGILAERGQVQLVQVRILRDYLLGTVTGGLLLGIISRNSESGTYPRETVSKTGRVTKI